MSKAEKFISDYTRNCSNELGAIESIEGTRVISYHEWLTPDQARKAVEIAREEIYKWIREYVYIYTDDLYLEGFIRDLKKAMKDE